MKKTNLSLLDKTVRISIALGITILFFTGVISELTAVAGLVAALFFAGTGFSGYCPVYRIFGIKTHLNLNDKYYKSHKRFRSI